MGDTGDSLNGKVFWSSGYMGKNMYARFTQEYILTQRKT